MVHEQARKRNLCHHSSACSAGSNICYTPCVHFNTSAETCKLHNPATLARLSHLKPSTAHKLLTKPMDDRQHHPSQLKLSTTKAHRVKPRQQAPGPAPRARHDLLIIPNAYTSTDICALLSFNSSGALWALDATALPARDSKSVWSSR